MSLQNRVRFTAAAVLFAGCAVSGFAQPPGFGGGGFRGGDGGGDRGDRRGDREGDRGGDRRGGGDADGDVEGRMQRFMGFMQRFRRHLGTVEKVMGVFLIITGIMFLTGSITWMGQWLIENVPFLSQIEEWATPKGLQQEIIQQGTGK